MTTSAIAQALDTILDRTVVGGYSNVGYRARSHGFDDNELARMDGKVVLVTGATSGLGLAAAEGFARLGASVRVIARNGTRGERTSAEIRTRTGHDDVHFGVCDLADMTAVANFATRFVAENERLDVLVNNAGALMAQRTLSVDGIELTFATNVVGPFLLTNQLMALIRHSAPARIINVSSGGMYTQKIDVEDLQTERRAYDGAAVYAATKRAEVILTELWAQRLGGTGVVVHAMHPGWVDTPGLAASLPRFYRASRVLLRTPQQGADTIVWLGASPRAAQSSGGFWHDRRERPVHRLPQTRETAAERERLWAECERLTAPFTTPSRVATQAAG